MDDLCEGLGRSHDLCPDINWQSTCKFSIIFYILILKNIFDKHCVPGFLIGLLLSQSQSSHLEAK